MDTAPHSAAYQLSAALHAAAFAPITDRAFLRITGPDAGRWLNGMVTNSIQTLAAGEGCYNFLLNAQGRIQGDCTIYRETGEDEMQPGFLLETDTTQADTIHQHLDRFIIMDDVEISPVHDIYGLLVAGPQALSIVMALGRANNRATPCSPAAQALPQPDIHLKKTIYGGASVLLIQAHSRVAPHFEIWSGESTIGSILMELRGTSAVAASPADLEAYRILSGTPQYGTDIRNTDLPQETAQAHALHFAKGCYLGQEIVERIRSRGQVHRQFTVFQLTGELPASLPAPLESAGKPAGEITSAAVIPLAEGPTLIGLGYARREALDTKQHFTYLGGIAAQRRISNT